MNIFNLNFVPKNTRFVIGQKAVLFNNQEHVLILQRSAKSGAGGKWSLPGGALEENEDPISSVQREILEETTLSAYNLVLFSLRSYKHEKDHVLIIGYKCSTFTGRVSLNWEHDNYQWLPVHDALEAALTEDARYFLERV